MPINVYQQIRTAILEMKQVNATYRGYQRKLCPHVLGSKSGIFQALFYQFGGDSALGLEPDGSAANWRCMYIDELEDVELVDGEWHTAPNRSRPQSCVDRVHVEVDLEDSVTSLL